LPLKSVTIGLLKCVFGARQGEEIAEPASHLAKRDMGIEEKPGLVLVLPDVAHAPGYEVSIGGLVRIRVGVGLIRACLLGQIPGGASRTHEFSRRKSK
jgi:hypothetical protein